MNIFTFIMAFNMFSEILAKKIIEKVDTKVKLSIFLERIRQSQWYHVNSIFIISNIIIRLSYRMCISPFCQIPLVTLSNK